LNITVFCDVTPCCLVQCTGISEGCVVPAISSFLVYPDDGGDMCIWNAGTLSVDCTV